MLRKGVARRYCMGCRKKLMQEDTYTAAMYCCASYCASCCPSDDTVAETAAKTPRVSALPAFHQPSMSFPYQHPTSLASETMHTRSFEVSSRANVLHAKSTLDNPSKQTWSHFACPSWTWKLVHQSGLSSTERPKTSLKVLGFSESAPAVQTLYTPA